MAVPQRLPAAGRGTGWQAGGTWRHGQLEWSHSHYRMLPAEAVPIFLPCNLGLLQLLPSYAVLVPPAQCLCRLCLWSQCQDPAAGECQRLHCLFANGCGH